MLPKIEYPIHTLIIPSTKKPHKFRPFLVKEEKILLMAKESEDSTDFLSAMKQIVNNCCLTQKFNVNSCTVFDIEYLFLKLRALSVDNISRVSYIDNEDNKTYNFEINLDEIEVKFPEKIKNNIKITDTAGIIMKYPSAELFDDKKFLKETKEHLFELIIKCLDSVYDGDTIYNAKDYKKAELVEFVENLSVKTFEEINSFLMNIPKLYYEINYKNSLGNDRKIILGSLDDFF